MELADNLDEERDVNPSPYVKKAVVEAAGEQRSGLLVEVSNNTPKPIYDVLRGEYRLTRTFKVVEWFVWVLCTMLVSELPQYFVEMAYDSGKSLGWLVERDSAPEAPRAPLTHEKVRNPDYRRY